MRPGSSMSLPFAFAKSSLEQSSRALSSTSRSGTLGTCASRCETSEVEQTLLTRLLVFSHLSQTRVALFFGAATVAGAFSGLLAYGISFMACATVVESLKFIQFLTSSSRSGVGGYNGWRWIFVRILALLHTALS